jgi:hypothetical protein
MYSIFGYIVKILGGKSNKNRTGMGTNHSGPSGQEPNRPEGNRVIFGNDNQKSKPHNNDKYNDCEREVVRRDEVKPVSE